MHLLFSRRGWPLRQHQHREVAGGLWNHHSGHRPHEHPGQDHRRNRLAKGRHHEAWGAYTHRRTSDKGKKDHNYSLRLF